MKIKKSFIYFTLVVLLATITIPASAQEPTKAQRKVAKKEAKAFAKEGWTVKPGNLSLEEQFAVSKQILSEVDNSGYPVWIGAESSTIGSVYNAAKSSALIMAKRNLGLILETSLAEEIAASSINEELGQESSNAINKVKETIKGHMENAIGNVRFITECHRTLSNGNIEVLLRIAVKRTDAIKAGANLLKQLDAKE